jgi:hypothetical protein
METSMRVSAKRRANICGDLARGTLWVGWQAVRLLILSFFVVLEPIIRVLFSGLAMLGVLMAFLFEFSGAAPDFPFWQTLAISSACVVVLVAYYWAIRLLSR